MKKWLEHILAGITDRDWNKHLTPIANLDEKDHFARLKETFYAARPNLPVANGWNMKKSEGVGGTPQDIMDGYGIDVSEWIWEYPDLDHHRAYVTQMVRDEPFREYIIQKFGLDREGLAIRLNVMEPGMMGVIHIDRQKGNNPLTGNPPVRYIAFMDNWQWGQAFQVGEQFIQWKSGDVFEIEEGNLPHGGSNFGYETRFLIRITGSKKVDS